MTMVEDARRERSIAGKIFGFGRGRRPSSTDRRRRIGESWYVPYLFLLPHFLIFAALILVPFFLGIWISLHRSTPLREGPFVGAANFMQLFDPASLEFERYWTTVWNTVLFVIMSTPLLVIVGLVLAALLNQKMKGRNFFRGVFFAPWTLSVAVVGLTW